jgi:hypothetical protein
VAAQGRADQTTGKLTAAPRVPCPKKKNKLDAFAKP